MAAGAVLLAACTGGGGGPAYPREVVDRFLEACDTVSGNHGFCSCLIEEFQDAVPLQDFLRAEDGILYGGPIDAATREQLSEITVGCIERNG